MNRRNIEHPVPLARVLFQLLPLAPGAAVERDAAFLTRAGEGPGSGVNAANESHIPLLLIDGRVATSFCGSNLAVRGQ
jgi:hypothetical protein